MQELNDRLVLVMQQLLRLLQVRDGGVLVEHLNRHVMVLLVE